MSRIFEAVLVCCVVWGVVLGAGCGDKHRCNLNSDCEQGRVCDDGECTSAGSLCSGGTCLLASIGPRVAETGGTVEIEGDFSADTMVQMPGTPAVTPVFLSRHRLSVTVPDKATSGSLTIISDGIKIAAEDLRRISFTPSLTATAIRPQPVGVRQASILTVPRSRPCMMLSGHVYWALGGEDEHGVALASVERAAANTDGSLGVFTVEPSVTLVIPRAQASCVELDDTVYVIGGIDDQGRTLDSIERANIDNSGDIGPFSVIGQAMHSARSGTASVVIGNQLYVVGGRGADGLPLDSLERAFIDSQTSIRDFDIDLPHLAKARADASVAVAGGQLFVMGGAGPNGVLQTVEVALISDTNVRPFTPGSPLLEPRARAASFALGTTVYLLGGENDFGPLASIERATVGETLSFMPVSPGLMQARTGAGVARWGNFLHLVGGSSAFTESLAFDDGLDLAGMFSTVSSPTAFSREEAGFASIGRNLYAIGGYNTDTERDVVDAVIGNGDLGTFIAPTTPVVTLKTPRRTFTTAIIGSWLYVIGGENADNVAEPTIERSAYDHTGQLLGFDVYSDSDGNPVELVHPRAAHSSVIVGNYLYVLGGADQFGNFHTIERASILSTGDLSAFTEDDVTLLFDRRGAAAVVLGSGIFVMGGFVTLSASEPGGQAVPFVERVGFGPSGTLVGPSMTMVPLTEPRADAAAVIVDKQVLLLGGFGTVPLQSIDAAVIGDDGMLPKWNEPPALMMTLARNAPGAMVVENGLYAFGGARNFIAVPSNERWNLSSK